MNTLLIDGNTSDLRQFARPIMSLSSARSNMNRHTFRLTLNKELLLSDYESKYRQWVKDSKIEDEESGGVDPDDLIGVAGYPELRKLLEEESLVEELFGWYFLENVFDNYCCTDHKIARYWYDEIEGASVSESSVSIYGVCYSRRQD